MSQLDRHEHNAEDWETGKLGRDEKHVRKSAPDRKKAVDEALGMQLISIRLQRSLIDQLKYIAQFHGIGYQPLVRDLLHRFARSEMINIHENLVRADKARSKAEAAKKGATGECGPAAAFITEKKRKQA